MDEALKLANDINSGESVVEYDDHRVDVVCRALIDAHKRIAELRAENAKLRRVVEAAQKLRPMFHLVADEEIELDDALSALEPPNVPDATDDKG